jgi:hypothetical protein
MASHTLHLIRPQTARNTLLLLLVIFIYPLYALKMCEPDRALTREVVGYIINNHYDSALAKVHSHSNWQSEPLLPLLKLCILSLRDVDFDRTVDSAQFMATYAQTISSVELWEKKHQADSYSLMISGMARAISAASLLRQKRYIPALQLGLDALDLLGKAQELDSNNYEVDLVLGLYEYGRAELRSKFWWVLFWYPGDRESGIRRVERCAKNATLTAEAARISLCDIFVQERRFNDAHVKIDELKNAFPESRFVLWSEVKCYEAEKKFESAANVYGRLSNLYASAGQGEYNALFTKSREAFMLNKCGSNTAARAACEIVLADANITKYKELKRETIKLSERCNDTRN